MKKNVLLSILLILLALTFGSCRRMAEKAARKVRIEAVEEFRLRGLTGAEMVLRIANDTRYNIELDQVELTLHYKENPAITLRLHESIEIDKRSTESIATRWKLKAEGLAMMLVARDLYNDDSSQIRVSFRIEGHGGPARIDIAQEKMLLSDFLSIFGITLQELKNQIRSYSDGVKNTFPQ